VGLEPAFARNSGTWPLAGMHMPLEPDDPRLAIPHNAFPVRQAREESYVLTSNAALDKKPAEPLGAGNAAGKPPKSKRWKAAIAGSCAFHAAIALCFLAGIDESAKIAGADQAGIAQLGNAAEDARSAGTEIDPAVTDVSIITMLNAKPVETVAAEAVTDANAAEPVETVEPETPIAETVEPLEAAPVEPETSAQTAPAAEPEPAEPAPQETAAAVAETAPEILATDTVQPVDDENTVAPSARAVEQAVEPTEETAPEAPAETVAEAPAETVAEPVPEETFETLAEVAPIPEPRPEAPAAEKPAEKVEKKRAPEKETPAKPREQKSAERRTAGSKGNATADTRRGQADGQAQGSATADKGGNRQSAAGNAAVSNYPGKIVSKLRRAAKRQKLQGEVRVAFTVSANGSVGGVRVVRSSGSPVLDKAAIETVRRAAPFPAIPEGAGRSSWPFTVPLLFAERR
jgi:periplasmic protein TonB